MKNMWEILIEETKDSINNIKNMALLELDEQYLDLFSNKSYVEEQTYSYKSALLNQTLFLAECQNSYRNHLNSKNSKKD